MTYSARLALAPLLMAVSAMPVAAMPPHLGSMGRPAFLDELFPPPLVMRNQDAIHLSQAQREAITKAMADTQARLVELQWKFEEQSSLLTKLLGQPTVDSAAALAQAERVMVVEQEMKKAHLALLIQIKNQLDAKQQATLRDLRGRGGRRRGGAEPPPEAEDE